MDITHLQKIILGAVQGLTEFLPVSSSAHLILVPRYFHWTDPGLAFDVALHLGTLLGVALVFWKDLWGFAKALQPVHGAAMAEERRLLGYVVLATIPGAVAGLVLEHKVETVFRSPFLIAWTLMGMGLGLWLADTRFGGQKTVKDLSWKTVLLVGAAQGLAVVPGLSRSGITIAAALLLGLCRTEAARFSFLLSMPIIAGAGLLKFKEILVSPDKVGIVLGFSSAAVTGFLAVRFLLRYVQAHRYTPFVIYRVLLGIAILFQLSKF